MNVRAVVAAGVACLLVGILVGYLAWGLRSARLAGELEEVKASLVAQAEQVAERQGHLAQAESRLKQLTTDLEFERQRRAKLELLAQDRLDRKFRGARALSV